jgi:hypothetical protein
MLFCRTRVLSALRPSVSTLCQHTAAGVAAAAGGVPAPSSPLQQPPPTPFAFQANLVINDPRLMQVLEQLQDENRRLMEENRRVNQIDADRLRLEHLSKEAFIKIDELQRVNQQLREENERLKQRVDGLEAGAREVKASVLELEKKNALFEGGFLELQRQNAYLRVAQSLVYVDNACRKQLLTNTSLDKRGLVALSKDENVRAKQVWKDLVRQHPLIDDQEVLCLFEDLVRGRVRVAHPSVSHMSIDDLRRDMHSIVTEDEVGIADKLLKLVWEFPV